MKKYRKNNVEVKAVQYDGTEKTIEEIKELLGERGENVEFITSIGSNASMNFTLITSTKSYLIYPTDWIIKDDPYFCRASDDVFVNKYTEIKE